MDCVAGSQKLERLEGKRRLGWIPECVNWRLGISDQLLSSQTVAMGVLPAVIWTVYNEGVCFRRTSWLVRNEREGRTRPLSVYSTPS